MPLDRPQPPGTHATASMFADLSVFLLYKPPNGTTWFYFSFLLAMALFFRFGRLLSIRNGDVVMMFLLVPALLVMSGSRPEAAPPIDHPAVQAAGLIGQTAALQCPIPIAARVGAFAEHQQPAFEVGRWLWFSYLWLMCGSVYFFCRCIFDLALVQRPALGPNLSFGGLAWLAGALLICLMAVAFFPEQRQGTPTPTSPTPTANSGPVQNGSTNVPAATAEGGITFLVQQLFGPPVWVCRLFAVLCHVAIVLGLVTVGWRHFSDASAGMAAATFYLVLPYTGMFVGQTIHAWPGALLVWAVAAYRFPMLAGTLLGLATGTAFFPLVVMPAWVSFYAGRGAGRFLIAWAITLALCVVNFGVVLGDTVALWAALQDGLALWLPWREPVTEGFWTGVHAVYRLPVFIAYVAFLLATAVWPSPKNLARLLALSAATVIGLQLWYADQGGVFVLWYAPLLLLLTFRPNLQDHRPPLIDAETDWLARGRRWVVRSIRRLARFPEPAQVTRV